MIFFSRKVWAVKVWGGDWTRAAVPGMRQRGEHVRGCPLK